MAIEEEPEPGIPEWVVTFGDMMSLLLTFFIMLVSMSEIKEEKKFQAMLESMRRQFGHEATVSNILPGDSTPRNSTMSSLASMGRAKRLDIMRGGNPVQAVSGESPQVQTIRPGTSSTTGGVIFFDELSDTLSEDTKLQLRQIAAQVRGKPQRLEIRGHASRKPPADGDKWALAFNRAEATMHYLLQQGIEQQRIRVSSAADTEPLDNGLNEENRKRNARVEILMWDEPIATQTTL
ncbi:Motility protein B [Posidoniimonas polymericola]|uniref:Motility protein B n=1 Tax=Posidoniimonas polymericola TaxID=2528002 RepID=A0A5C5YR59_9BACT|nr:flagellar motor protein MotB [Posidoniimonas polymericola]TWT77227.1 Motility protein B [Posidoniimonas polymericola]